MAADPVARYVPDVPFPAYAYAPGRSPHPHRDPRGFDYAAAAGPVSPLRPEGWASCRPYLYGVDLFNHGYYWEAHEAWEALWHACGRRGTTADFLKGLIRLAAAGVKAREGKPAGVVSHARRVLELLHQVQEGTVVSAGLYCGLDLAALTRQVQEVMTTEVPGTRLGVLLRPAD